MSGRDHRETAHPNHPLCHSVRVAPVTISIPADAAYINVLRSTVANIATRSSFTLEEIEDLRIAVSEAATLLLPLAEVITCTLESHDDEVVVTCSCAGTGGPRRDFDDLPWVLLEALVDELSTVVTQTGVEIRMCKKRVLQT